MEGAATTVYAQGGRGNSRLMAWEGERTVTFTMEDALISPAGFMILAGAGLIEASESEPIMVHATEQIASENGRIFVAEGDEGTSDYAAGDIVVELSEVPHFNVNEDFIYVMVLKNGEVDSEPYIPAAVDGKKIILKDSFSGETRKNDLEDIRNDLTNDIDVVVLVDYYTKKIGGASEITITPDKFGGYYYLEASTLFRNTDGVDMPAEFIIPNCKIQSNFTFTMASSGDPSTFTFTIDAFPDYTRFNKTKKVLAAIQIVTSGETGEELSRVRTHSLDVVDNNGMIVKPAGSRLDPVQA